MPVIRINNNMRISTLVLILLASYGTASAQKSELAQGQTDPMRVSVYPNPASDFISLKVPGVAVRDARITVFSLIGNEVRVEQEIIDDEEIRLRVKDLPSGYYLLAVRHEEAGFQATRKFLKR